jgi:FkbH-like protein
MNEDNQQPAPDAVRPAHRIAIAATFTAEPVKESLGFWLDELGLSGSIAFAPYNQIFQELLDPGSLLSRNHEGINVLLVRLEDWLRFGAGSASRGDLQEHLERTAAELVGAVRTAASRSAALRILAFCPASPTMLAQPGTRDVFARIEDRITAELGGIPGFSLLRGDDFQAYPVQTGYDPQRDRIGHIPYTPTFYAAVGTILARRIHALTSPPYKVVVVDADNTLWKGVVGEEGVAGIAIPPAWRQLQQFLVGLPAKGFVLGLCSKNDEADVLAVFEQRWDMVLKRDHLVCWRINWQSKSENIRSMARELNLGLDSFIFLDDNPVECAEVQDGCPEVLTLPLPVEGERVRFLEHIWAFDRVKVTAEDQQRTAMYRQELERARFQKETPTIRDFLAGLDLRISISEPAPEQLGRVAQLTQRTNQFNFTTIRRGDGEIQRLPERGLECRVVSVSDRFGDYGLVGVMIFATQGDVLEVDTFLLSCRVLGRGVEHRMLNELGEIARRRGQSRVEAVTIPTRQNQPARDFLASVGDGFREDLPGRLRYRIPAEVAARVVYTPELARTEVEMAAPAPAAASGSPGEPMGRSKSRRFERIATELYRPEQVLATIRSRSLRRRGRTAEDRPFVAARTEIEAALVEIWTGVLQLEPVGIQDDFFNWGGTSLLAVDLMAQIEHRFGRRLPLVTLIEAPTVERLARLLADGPGAERDSLVLIRDGGDKPPIFLVHDGDGETLLYRNLALRLKADHAVFGLHPRSRGGAPMVHTRIAEMAADHLERIRSVQRHGPYLLGGMCAGGVVAFEIARQLQDLGEKVAMVALLDSANVAALPKAWHFAKGRARSFATLFHQDPSARFGGRVLAVLARAARKARNLTVYLIGRWIKELRDEIRMRLFRWYVDRRLPLPRLLKGIPVRTVYLFAEREYQPQGQFEGELVLFRATATSSGAGDEPFVERYDDPLLGWGRRATRGVRVLDVLGGHSSMLQEPNVQVLAEQMQSYLDETLAGEPAAPTEEWTLALAGDRARLPSLPRLLK